MTDGSILVCQRHSNTFELIVHYLQAYKSQYCLQSYLYMIILLYIQISFIHFHFQYLNHALISNHTIRKNTRKHVYIFKVIFCVRCPKSLSGFDRVITKVKQISIIIYYTFVAMIRSYNHDKCHEIDINITEVMREEVELIEWPSYIH